MHAYTKNPNTHTYTHTHTHTHTEKNSKMAAVLQRFTKWSQDVYNSFFEAALTVRKIQEEKDEIDPNASARRAAFMASGLSIDPRVLLDARTGEVRRGSEFRNMLNDSLLQGTERASRIAGAPALMFQAQVDMAQERMRGYQGFELRVRREMRDRKVQESHSSQEDTHERILQYRRMLLQAGSARKQSQVANILVYFTLEGYPRQDIMEIRSANAALLKWHQGGHLPSLKHSPR
jgi:hypothetical protein